MSITGNTFYDKYGNFDNTKLIKMLEEAREKQYRITKATKGLSGMEISLFNSVTRKEVWQFINKLSIFINSGIDIKSGLGILAKQTKNPYMKKIVIEIRDNIDHGIAINETMEQYPKVFDNLTIALIKVGEKTGKLGEILNELDTSMLENIELKAKVKGAMIYPAILLILTFSMVIFMMTFIVPKITEAFAKAGSTLPKPTQVLVNISNFLMNDYLLFIGTIIGIIVFLKLLNKTYFGKVIFANLFINLPIFGYIVRQSNIVYFIKSFTLLLNSGVLLLESLKTSSQVVSNLAYKKELIRIKNEVELGLTISKSLGLNTDYDESVYLNKLFSEEFAYVVSTGEETGSLSVSMEKMGRSYNGELKRYIRNLSAMMEPIIIIIVGFLVGAIVISIMLPFFEMGKVAKNL